MRCELTKKRLYWAIFRVLSLCLLNLQVDNQTVRKIRKQGLPKSWHNINELLYQEDLLYIWGVIKSEQISRHHNNSLAGHFEIDKTWQSIIQKYYWSAVWVNIELYVKGYNVCLASKAMGYKSYNNVLLLLIPLHL